MKKLNINRILILAIIAPIVVILLVAGLPAIWKGITVIAKVLVPNFWTVFAYAYIALVAFLFGLKKGKKEASSQN